MAEVPNGERPTSFRSWRWQLERRLSRLYGISVNDYTDNNQPWLLVRMPGILVFSPRLCHCRSVELCSKWRKNNKLILNADTGLICPSHQYRIEEIQLSRLKMFLLEVYVKSWASLSTSVCEFWTSRNRLRLPRNQNGDATTMAVACVSKHQVSKRIDSSAIQRISVPWNYQW